MQTVLVIDGMRSVHCTRAVFTALTAVEGIISADVRLGRAVIEHDARASLDAMREALSAVGYTVAAVRRDRRRLPLL